MRCNAVESRPANANTDAPGAEPEIPSEDNTKADAVKLWLMMQRKARATNTALIAADVIALMALAIGIIAIASR